MEEAQEKALALLGAGETDDVQIEVLNMPKKKVLGLFGGNDAEVRVFVELPDPKPAKKPKNAVQKPAQNDKKAAPQKKASGGEKTAEAKPAVSTVDEDYQNAVDASTLDPNGPAARAVNYLKGILATFNCNIESIKAAEKENGVFIVLEGEGLGSIIGHRGETLDSLQYLASLAANNGNGYYKVSLNIGDYRQKREQSLIALAGRVSAQVLRSGRSRALEPMNPYERRIIHTAVQGIDGVISNSIGEGKNRRVVIAPEGGDTRPPRRDNYNRGGNRRGRERRPSNTVATTPTREPKKDSDRPLYGKIN